MPVLLTEEGKFHKWLKGTPKEAFAPSRQYPPEGIHIVQELFDKLDRYKTPADTTPRE